MLRNSFARLTLLLSIYAVSACSQGMSGNFSSNNRSENKEGKPEKNSSDNNDLNVNDVDAYDETSEKTPSSEIPVQRVCSNAFTSQFKTNVFLADEGIDIVIRGSDGVKHVLSNSLITSTIISKLINEGKLEINFSAAGVPDGTYNIHLCDKAFPSCQDLNLPAATQQNQGSQSEGIVQNVYSFFNAIGSGGRRSDNGPVSASNADGFIGAVLGVDVKDAKLANNVNGVVLLNANYSLRARSSNLFGGFKQVLTPGGNQKLERAPNADNTRKTMLRQAGELSLAGENEVENCDKFASPLVLDFANNGVTSPLKAAFNFDIEAKGESVPLAHSFGQDDFLLAIDLNDNGKIDDGKELFGSVSVLTDGRKASNGFIALANYDKNQDGVIDAKDPVFDRLRLIQFDRPQLHDLRSKQVRSITVSYMDTRTVDKLTGNEVRQKSSFKLKNGEELPIVDIWFRLSGSSAAIAKK